MAVANWLWGAPRIHGELLKLGIAISERTVSRYLRGRPTTRSQTWRTFFANHLADRTFIWPVLFADARGDDVVVDASDVSARPVPLSSGRLCASTHWARIDWDRSLQRPLVACVSAYITFTAQARARAPAGTRRGIYGCNWPQSVWTRFLSCVPAVPL